MSASPRKERRTPGAAPPLRVALLSERADFYGGGQRSLCDLATGLRAAGGGAVCDPLVVLPERGALAEALEASGVACEFLPLPSWRTAFPAALRAWIRLATLTHRRRVRLLHSDAPRTAFYGGTVARAMRRRHVWHLRASRPAAAPIERLLLALSDRVVAVSRAAAGRSDVLKRSSRVRVVPTGLPPIAHLERAAARDRLGLPREPFLIGIVGRVEPDKGGEDAIAALPAIRRGRGDARLVFLGAAPPGDRHVAALRRLAEAAGVADAVAFAGHRPEAATLLTAFDVIAHPSRHEALPRALIEALFAGVPVVAGGVGGVPEVIEPGRCGLLVPPGDPRALAEAVTALAGDADLRRRFGDSGRLRARTLFSIDAMLGRILEVYGEVVPGDGTAADWSPRIATRRGEEAR